MHSFLVGARFVISGYRQLAQPQFRRYAIAPCLVSLAVLAVLVGTVFSFTLSGVQQLDFDWQFTNWASFLNPFTTAIEWILKSVIVVLTTLALLFLCVYSFTFISATLLSPWLSDLSASISRLHGGTTLSLANDSQRSLWSDIVANLGREARKIKRYLLLAVVALTVSLVLGWIPGVAALTWGSLTAWWLAFEYCDYHTDNQGGSFADTNGFMHSHRLLCLGFGGAALLATMIPVINFFVVPACVCGATQLRIKYALEAKKAST